MTERFDYIYMLSRGESYRRLTSIATVFFFFAKREGIDHDLSENKNAFTLKNSVRLAIFICETPISVAVRVFQNET